MVGAQGRKPAIALLERPEVEWIDSQVPVLGSRSAVIRVAVKVVRRLITDGVIDWGQAAVEALQSPAGTAEAGGAEAKAARVSPAGSYRISVMCYLDRDDYAWVSSEVALFGSRSSVLRLVVKVVCRLIAEGKVQWDLPTLRNLLTEPREAGPGKAGTVAPSPRFSTN